MKSKILNIKDRDYNTKYQAMKFDGKNGLDIIAFLEVPIHRQYILRNTLFLADKGKILGVDNKKYHHAIYSLIKKGEYVIKTDGVVTFTSHPKGVFKVLYEIIS